MKRIFLTLVLLPFMVVSANAQSLIVGDANSDGSLDISDVVTIVNRVLEGNPVSYQSCPDSHHPHLINLGLPSGTLWSCCNVDALKPEDFGGYYAWGESQEKSQYDLSTYSHYDSTNRYHDLGNDISGSHYDVAHVKWGGDWRMPGDVAFQEIIDCCSSEFVNVNGVEGLKFTGPNGGSIFFPNSGYKTGTSIGYDGTYGYAWTSAISSLYDQRYGPSYVLFYKTILS